MTTRAGRNTKGHDRAEAMECPRHVRAAEDSKDDLRPVGVVELQRHARDDQQQETGHDQEMQEALERREAREPFLVAPRLRPLFPERFRVAHE